MQDAPYQAIDYRLSEMVHAYGPRVHLLADPVLLTEVGQMGLPATQLPELASLVRDLYRHLARLLAAWRLPRQIRTLPSRMQATTPAAIWRGELLAPAPRVVVVDIARAGTLPAQTVFEVLCRLVGAAGIRQDHLLMNRVHNAAGQVVGVDVLGSKASGPVADALLIIPDPMGATGSSMRRALEHYRRHPDGPPRAIVALNLIVTPEYLRALTEADAEVEVVAVRLDRGLSLAPVRDSGLGDFWNEERGLNDRQYIIPGAGGLGELLNNCAD